MAADEYYDAIGEVLSYVLSAENIIRRQRRGTLGKRFVINRDGDLLELDAQPNSRYFTIIYQSSISQKLKRAYENDSSLLGEHMDRYEIEDSVLREAIEKDIAAYERLDDGVAEEAERILSDLRSYYIHSDCRVRRLGFTDPRKDSDENSDLQEDNVEKLWDGFKTIGLLYPYEENFSPRDYEQVAQEVISLGNQIDDTMKQKLDVFDEIESTLH